jgi:predicted nucleic acid-binding protein
MTLAELDLWALRRNWGESTRERLERFLRKFTVGPYDRELCRKWAEVTDSARQKGRPIDVADAWVAATALLAGVPLVTHNPGDYAGVDGLPLLTAAIP